MDNRGTFGSRFTAIMAMAGSAIGLGNIWRFPYIAGKYGGGAFIIVYLLSAVFICIPIFLSESIIGKSTRLGTFGAMRTLAPGSKWKWMGLITVLTPLLILSYYSVVGGWSVQYLVKAIGQAFGAGAAGSAGAVSDTASALATAAVSQVAGAAEREEFARFISSTWKPIVAHSIFLLANALVVVGGVKKGIEKFTKITTPVLFVLIVVIMFYSISLPGAQAGVNYLVHADFSKLTAEGVLSAMGQAFFSLSLGVGTILTYASYMRKEDNIIATGCFTAGFDLIFAMIAGFAIMPAVFAAGIEPGAGPGLIFETLPYIFTVMGEQSPFLSGCVSILFFLTIFFAALTSSISMLEVGVSYLVDEKNWSRGKSILVVCTGCWLVGILCSLSFGPLSGVKIMGNSIFDFCDKLASNFLMVLGSLLFVLFAGWKMKKSILENEIAPEGSSPSKFTLFKILYFLIRYVAPLAIIVIFVTNLLM